MPGGQVAAGGIGEKARVASGTIFAMSGRLVVRGEAAPQHVYRRGQQWLVRPLRHALSDRRGDISGTVAVAHQGVHDVVGIFLLEPVVLRECLENKERGDAGDAYGLGGNSALPEQLGSEFDRHEVSRYQVCPGDLERG